MIATLPLLGALFIELAGVWLLVAPFVAHGRWKPRGSRRRLELGFGSVWTAVGLGSLILIISDRLSGDIVEVLFWFCLATISFLDIPRPLAGEAGLPARATILSRFLTFGAIVWGTLALALAIFKG